VDTIGSIDFEAVRGIKDEVASSRMYHRILNTIGHDHSGALYVSAEHAVAPLFSIAVSEPGWPANTALEVLVDMLGSFVALPAATQEQSEPPPGMTQRMRLVALRYHADLERMANESDLFGTGRRARELLGVLSEESG